MMMVTCRWVQDRLLIYLAGELDSRLAVKVVRHLERCGRCTRVAEELAEAQEMVEGALRTGSIIVAPPTLDERVMAAVRLRRQQQPQIRSRPAKRLAGKVGASCTMAAALLGIGFVLGRAYNENVPAIAIPSNSTNSSPIAAPEVQQQQHSHGLVEQQQHGSGKAIIQPPALRIALVGADHRKLLAGETHAEITGADPARVTRAMSDRFPFAIAAADMGSAGARLLGGRSCRLQGLPAALFLYEWQGRRVSLFQMDARRIALPRLREEVFDGECFLIGEQDGLSYALWCTGRTNHVLVAQASPQELLRLASVAAVGTRVRVPTAGALFSAPASSAAVPAGSAGGVRFVEDGAAGKASS